MRTMRVKIIDLDDENPEAQAIILESEADCKTPAMNSLYCMACDLGDLVLCGRTLAIPERLW